MKLKLFLQLFAGLAIVLTLLPLLAIDYWWIRVFDFPHIQLTILTFTAFITYFMRFKIKEWKDYIFVTALIACLGFQYSKIHAYTPYAKEEAKSSSTNYQGELLKLYTANVYQKNKKPEKLQQEIIARDADILLFLEAHKPWQNKILEVLPTSYTYKVEVPLDNTYGMLLYSKLELVNPQVRYLVDDSIPSIATKVILRSGDTVQMYNIHPTPPMPQHNPTSSDRDAEMMKIANMSRESKYPVLVLGDFNDVAWSATTSLFHNVGELLDPRKGRGFFNTFSAKSTFMRWPLDHVFISSEFRVKHIEVGSDINSDHFPTYTELSFEPSLKDEQKPKKPTEKELKRAKEQANGVEKFELDY
ncbi:endonuclease/exonuclease/phosphatase family protein [Rasiella sp. SM2506]|uniref:endonuclease/exonuclease/phosphatase family protein n=1 Tax=Rasiella sp. SM2506 TaxID=3423914 RepID=UPI003D797234